MDGGAGYGVRRTEDGAAAGSWGTAADSRLRLGSSDLLHGPGMGHAMGWERRVGKSLTVSRQANERIN